ncbi:MAG TPA: hypothetical protein PLM93_10925 [Sulfuricurvum sp.]|nr:MAG: hypothetical protein B7Y30_08440 [Campylobacterales bacterium 16-40-21]OZA02245.1 MAG: hypothetical protein B7X89_10050 [Sulfuricurvum sp. 17-40-25]HQS67684.1 hypothetical protein [Sulfuricurvum sp.]HQT37171.1 hypothetical protein [Sulfuricurvum sp.]
MKKYFIRIAKAPWEIKLMVIFYVIIALFTIMIEIFPLLIALGGMSQKPFEISLKHFITMFLVILIFSLPHFFYYYSIKGLLQYKNWGRRMSLVTVFLIIIAIILLGITMLNKENLIFNFMHIFLIFTLSICVYILYYLSKKTTKAIFKD